MSAKTAKPKKEWRPTYFTEPFGGTSDGQGVIDFAESFLEVSKGRRAGEPLVFTPWQQWLISCLLERRADGRLRYRRALVGLPRKNGKSLIGSALALYGLFAGEAGAEVYSAAGDRKQARIVFDEAKKQVMRSPMLMNECKVYRDAIEVPAYGAVYRVLSADGKLQQGLNPSMVVFDELWVQRNDELWDALTLGSGARVDPLVVAFTTAGYDLDTVCGHLYDYGKAVASRQIDDPSFGFYWWEAPTDCNLADRKAWEMANPNLPLGILDEEEMESSTQQSSEMSVRRFRLNQWVRTQESWLPPGAWDRCQGEVIIDPDLPAFVGIDMALKHDSIAVVIAQVDEEQKIHVDARIWHPDGNVIDVHDVENHLRELHQRYNVTEFAYDPAYFQRSAESLADDGLPMVEYPQSSQRMVPACGATYEYIVNRKIVQGGNPMFTDQVLSAASRQTEQGWRLSKGKSRRKIDACIALVMAVDRATRRSINTPVPSIVSVW